VIADAISESDLLTLGLGCSDWPLTVAGSGLAIGLAAQLRAEGSLGTQAGMQIGGFPVIRGPALVISGSCSISTQAQVERMRLHHPAWRIDPERALLDADALVLEVVEWATSQLELQLRSQLGDAPILVYSTASAEEVRAARAARAARTVQDVRTSRETEAVSGAGVTEAVHGAGGAGRVEEAIETVLARITLALVEQGVQRLIIAGGETSGAVVRALGVRALRIGPEISPGVPWTATLDPADDEPNPDQPNESPQPQRPTLALALKSGNFGDPDFFLNAWSKLPC
jgi:uncharacterized protein YgbK (DUF1537 family)